MDGGKAKGAVVLTVVGGKNKKDKPKLVFFWQGRKDSNPRHPVLETGVLPTELYPYTTVIL